MQFNFASMYQRILHPSIGVIPQCLSARGVFKILVFFILIPLGLLITILGMLGFICLVTTLIPVYTIQYVFWRFSAQGRIQHLKEAYQRRQQRVIAHEQYKRIKFSQCSDNADMQYLVKLTQNEINKRKKNIDYIIFIETKRRLNRCLTEMNFDKAFSIHNVVVHTKLDLLNESLNQLFE